RWRCWPTSESPPKTVNSASRPPGSALPMAMTASGIWSRWSSWARLLMYTGMRIDSAEAVRIGLVDRVIPNAELWNATLDIARTIAGNAPLSIQAARITIAQILKDPGDRDMNAIKEIAAACMNSEDFREGRRAFMEKRKPQFRGR